MLLVPQGLFGDLPRDPYAGGPCVMWEGSEYAHIMVPLEKTTRWSMRTSAGRTTPQAN